MSPLRPQTVAQCMFYSSLEQTNQTLGLHTVFSELPLTWQEDVHRNCLETDRRFRENLWQVSGWTIVSHLTWANLNQSDQSLAKAGWKKSKNIFSFLKSFKCHSLLFFQWRNSLQFWNNWNHSIYADPFRSRLCLFKTSYLHGCLSLSSHLNHARSCQ